MTLNRGDFLYYEMNEDFLAHYGVKGMKWGHHIYSRIYDKNGDIRPRKAQRSFDRFDSHEIKLNYKKQKIEAKQKRNQNKLKYLEREHNQKVKSSDKSYNNRISRLNNKINKNNKTLKDINIESTRVNDYKKKIVNNLISKNYKTRMSPIYRPQLGLGKRYINYLLLGPFGSLVDYHKSGLGKHLKVYKK